MRFTAALLLPLLAIGSPAVASADEETGIIVQAPAGTEKIGQPAPLPMGGAALPGTDGAAPAEESKIVLQPGSAPAGAPIAEGHSTPVHGAPLHSAPNFSNCNECNICTTCESPRWRVGVFAEYLHMSPRGVDVPYAQPMNDFGPLAVPRGAPAIADTDYVPAFRGGFVIAVGEKGAIRGVYSILQNNNSSSIEAPENTILHSLVVFPATVNAFPLSLQATATYDIDYHIGDIDYAHQIWGCDRFALAVFVGARYVHLDQDFQSDFEILGRTTVLTDIDFDGAGPRVGLEGDCCLGYGFLAYGRGAASFVVGSFRADYLQTNIFAGTLAETSYSNDRIVPILEFEAGLGWQSKNGRLHVSAGYYVASWYNTVTTPGFINGVQSLDFDRSNDNLNDSILFDGFVGRVGLRY